MDLLDSYQDLCHSMWLMASEVRAPRMYLEYMGMAMAAKIPTMVTVIMSSISEKPFRFMGISLL